MKILYISPHQIWPLTGGARLRDYHLARGLATRSEVTVFEIRQPSDDNILPPPETGFAAVVSATRDPGYSMGKILRGLLGPTPLTVLNYFSPRIAHELERVLREGDFSTVQIENVHLAPYLPVLQLTPSRPALIADWHNIESELMSRYSERIPRGPRRFAARRTAQLLERLEAGFIANCRIHTVPSERERSKLRQRFPDARIEVIPNGVDAEFFAGLQSPRSSDNRRRTSTKRTLLFVGSMDYHANIDAVTWFVREVWPDVAHRHPTLDFTIVGRNPSREVCALSSERVCVTGTVADLRPFYANAFATIVPLRVGSGTRLKILEAMAAGVPVISTGLGAEGIDAKAESAILIADDPRDMLNAIDRLLASPNKHRDLSVAARALITERYDWSIIAERLYRLHLELAEATR